MHHVGFSLYNYIKIHGLQNIQLVKLYNKISGPGSSVGIATAYGLDGPGIKSRWGEIFRTSPDRP